VLALVDEFGSQLARMSAAGPKIVELLAMVPFPEPPPAEREAMPLRRLQRVIEDELDARLGEVFAEVEERPLAVASLGQVHRARTRDRVDVAVKVQHPGVAEAIERDLRNVGLVAPLLGRLAPGLDAGAVLAELRERISEEVDYEVEAQHHRRVERLYRSHPHVRVPRVRTDLSTRRMLVTEYVDGRPLGDVERLDEDERDRVGEIAFRFFFGLVRRHGIVAGDPAVDNLVLCRDGRLCVLDFGLMRDLDADYLEGERELMRALAERDADALHAGLSALGYLPEPERFDRSALLEHLHTAGEWFVAPGVRRLDPEDVRRTLELGYPPRSPWFSQMRRQRLPPSTLLLRRMEAVVLATLGQLRAAADWGTISAEYWAGSSPSTALGREEGAL
jgi:ABC1 atypical kinase-like domain